MSNVSNEIMLKRALLAARQGNLKMHVRGVRVLLYKRAVSCKCIQITGSVENIIGIRLIAASSYHCII
jgi:hypothetical protein